MVSKFHCTMGDCFDGPFADENGNIVSITGMAVGTFSVQEGQTEITSPMVFEHNLNSLNIMAQVWVGDNTLLESDLDFDPTFPMNRVTINFFSPGVQEIRVAVIRLLD